ncbi:MAG: PEP-CTERM sorting domain-containing protein [Mycobacterium sp.]
MVEVQLFGNQSNANVYSLVSVPEPSVAIGLCTSLVGLGLIYLRQHKAEHVLAA